MSGDASDGVQIEELIRHGELVQRAREKDVQVMVEGPGHVPMDQIAANMKMEETICHGGTVLCARTARHGYRPGL